MVSREGLGWARLRKPAPIVVLSPNVTKSKVSHGFWLFLELGCRADSKADDRAARVSKGRVQATLTLVDARVQARTTVV